MNAEQIGFSLYAVRRGKEMTIFDNENWWSIKLKINLYELRQCFLEAFKKLGKI